jgi:5-methylcytosine-specific restriction endonuclease McrBC GTP-binding regulatory subunit McrB
VKQSDFLQKCAKKIDDLCAASIFDVTLIKTTKKRIQQFFTAQIFKKNLKELSER